MSANPHEQSAAEPAGRIITRRGFLVGAGAAAAAGLAGKLWWDRKHAIQASVFIARHEAYDDQLADVIRRGLAELGIGDDWARGQSVLLKPNLVEPDAEAPHINTHPRFIRAVIEVFRRQGAREVFVAEGQGHVRDTYLVLEQSGLEPVLAETKTDFVDLNHDDVYRAANQVNFTKLAELYLPRSLQRADLIVSLPKLKTHHWAGATLSMKNLFGLMPGICYGWPKNVLHHQGIDQSIVDITGTVRPHLAIVDGIIGMEGDGPIMGTPKRANLVVMGTNLPAVDATAARLMDLDPARLDYLRNAFALGPIEESHIEQRGEPIAALRQRFELLDHPHFRKFRDS